MPDLLERLKSALGDRYGIEKEIDRGGMAIVFLAEDLKHGRQVAIKVLHPQLTSAVGGERFLKEIEIVAGLQHPHILPLHDSGEADELLYYVMPFVEGESLRARLEREGPIPVHEAVRIAAEVADGLDYAHRRGVIHRDVKPGNIMLSDRHAVIMDFGIARALTEARDDRLTGTGLTLGTPRYASPEQAVGTDALDGRSDIYSLGCVLYEMLSGEVPLGASTPQAMQQRRMTDTPEPLHSVRTTVPPVLDQVIAKALAPLPADRFESAAQFGQALNAVLGRTDESFEAAFAMTPAPKPAGALRRPWRGRSLGPGLAVLAIVAAVVGWAILKSIQPGGTPDTAGDVVPHADAVVALESYDKATHWFGKRTQKGIDTAIVHFRRATELDPSMAVAWAGLSEVLITGMFWRFIPEADSLRAEARAAALRGLDLDSTSVQVRTAWAGVLFEIDADTAAAEAELRRAIEIDPNEADAHRAYGDFLMTVKRGEEGRGEIEKAFELDPDSPILNHFLGNQAMSDFRYEEAVEHYHAALNLEPDFGMARALAAVSLACLGREDEARRQAEQVLERPGESNLASIQAARALYMIRDHEAALSALQNIREHGASYAPAWSVFAELERGSVEEALGEYRRFADGRTGQPYPPLMLAYIYARSGDAARARTLVEATEAEEPESINIANFAALVYAVLGETDLAMDRLERKYESKDDPSLLYGIAVDPVYDPLRDEPRFHALLERMNLADVPRPD